MVRCGDGNIGEVRQGWFRKGKVSFGKVRFGYDMDG
jgi:hypothetical protein